MANPIRNLKLTLISFFTILPLFASTAHAFGKAGPGGGNVIEENLADAGEISGWLQAAKEPARLALNQYEFVLRSMDSAEGVSPADSAKYKAIYQKLFGQERTVYQALDEAVFAPIPAGGCAGVDTTVDTDANSLKDPPNVCFSLENLSAKFHEKSGKPELIALVAHEVSHMVGATEDEAVLIQLMIQSMVSSAAFDLVAEVKSDFKQTLTDILDSTKELQRTHGAVQACTMLMAVQLQMGDVLNAFATNISSLGISVMQAKELGSFYAAYAKVVNLRVASCPTDKISRGQMRAIFNGKKQVTVRQILEGLGNSKSDIYPDDMVRWVKPGDRKLIDTELRDARVLLENVRKSNR